MGVSGEVEFMETVLVFVRVIILISMTPEKKGDQAITRNVGKVPEVESVDRVGIFPTSITVENIVTEAVPTLLPAAILLPQT